jgi:hypothetical protein
MTRAQQIRAECLLQLYAARPLSLSAAQTAKAAQRAGIDATKAEVEAEMAFLTGQHMAEFELSQVTGEARWKISSHGTLAYEQSQ